VVTIDSTPIIFGKKQTLFGSKNFGSVRFGSVRFGSEKVRYKVDAGTV
jgi:hypothetical protein